MSDLFQSKLQIGAILTDKNADGKLQPSSIANLQNLVNKTVQQNCKKLYLYISSHGFQGKDGKDLLGGNYQSGGIHLSQNVNGDFKDQQLSFEGLASILRALKNSKTELCLILDSCFSAAAIPAVQNLGISGLIATAADNDSFTKANYWSVFDGGYFTDGLVTIWDSFIPSPTNQVGLQKVMDSLFVRGKGLFPIEDPLFGHPQVATIDANGGVFPASDVFIPSSVAKGTPVTVVIKRPPGVTGTAAVSITIADATVAAFPGGSNTLLAPLLKPGTDSVTVTIMGVHDGTTTYTLKTEDSNNKIYMGTGTITVGDGYSVLPDPINLKVGETMSTSVFRTKALQGFTGQMTFTPDAAGIATVNPNPLNFNTGDASKAISITGIGPGTVTFTGVDVANRKTTFKVTVTGNPIGAACPSTGTSRFHSSYSIVSGFEHKDFIGLTTDDLAVAINGTGVIVRGLQSATMLATGSINPATCTFNATGHNTVAGFANTETMFMNLRILNVNGVLMLTGQFGAGTDHSLPGGNAAIYNLTGTVF